MSRLTDYMVGASAAVLMSIAALPAQADTEAFLGEVMPFGLDYCPVGWMAAKGQLLPVNQYEALFSLLGNVYGGDGRINFALPDLRGRVPMHHGGAPGLPWVALGNKTQLDPVKGSSDSYGLVVSPALDITYCINYQGIWPSRP